MFAKKEDRAGRGGGPPRMLKRKEDPGSRSRLGAMPRAYCVFNQTGESFLGMDICLADTPLARWRGLLGQFRLKSGGGLWVVPSHGLHTIGLLAPIDLIYLDAQNRVIHLVEHLSPFRIAPIRSKSSSVLELPPHTIYSSQTRAGDQLLICPPEDMEANLKKAGPVLSRRNPEGKGAELEDAM
jgi:uncharacterized membrane protein (UPF0127 family)